jgi:hypothetical protein
MGRIQIAVVRILPGENKTQEKCLPKYTMSALLPG